MIKRLIFEEKVKTNRTAFVDKVISISRDLAINPNWLMAVINSESAGTFSPAVENTKHPFKDGFATGLIQFIPSTARSLGTTTQKLKKMSGVEQLNFVKKYYMPFKGKINSYTDLYMCTFFPVAVGKPKNWVIKSDTISAGKIARMNPYFDVNKNGSITIGEAEIAMLKKFPGEIADQLKKKVQTIKTKQHKQIQEAQLHFLQLPLLRSA